MNSKILAICDSESTYADLLTRQLLRVPGNRIEIRKFTDLEKLKEFSGERVITYLLISEDMKENIHHIEALSYYILTNKKVGNEVDDLLFEYLYRYQGVNEIYKKITGLHIGDSQNVGKKRSGEELEFIGLYNPVRRNGQTTFARGLALELGKQQYKVLYLNLDEIGVSVEEIRDPEKIADGKGNISDIVYYLKQNPEQTMELFNRAVYRGRKYDVIGTTSVFLEMQEIKFEE